MVQAASRIALFALMLVVASTAAYAASARLDDVKVSTEDDVTVVTLHTSRVPRYTAELIDSPNRLVLDLEDTAYGWRTTPLAVTADPVKGVRGSQFRRDRARVVIELTRRAGFVVREEATGLAIVIPTATTPTASPDTSASRESTGDSSVPTRRTADATTSPAPAPVTASTPPESSPTTESTPETTAEAPRASAPVLAQTAPAPPPAPPVRPPAPPAQVITSRTNGQRLISLDFKEADIVNLLRILAAESGRNIVIGEDVKGKVSIALLNVPWEQALDTILESRGLSKIEKGDVIRIVSNEQLAKEREAAARVQEATRKAEAEVRTKLAEAALKDAEVQARKVAAEAAQRELEARGPLKEETVRLSYADPEEVENTLKGILGIPKEGTKAITGVPTVLGSVPLGGGPPVVGVAPPNPDLPAYMKPGPQPLPLAAPVPTSVSKDALNKGLTIRAHKPTNTIFLRLYARDMEIVKKLIRESLDVPLPQVKIEARMEILDRTALENIGVQWGGGFVKPSGDQVLVGQGLAQTGQNLGQIVPVFPGFITPDSKVPTIGDFTGVSGLGSKATSINPNSLLNAALPVSSLTGLPLGGNVVNLPPQSLSTESLAQQAAGGVTFGLIGARYNINLVLQALSNQGKTRTLARPEIVTVENAKAAMSLGEEIPFATVSSAGTQIQFKEALLKLEVTPTVIRESEVNRIKMIVVVENNNRGDIVNLGASGTPPAINRRKAETQVIIREGERLVIGGVAATTNRNIVRKVPLLGDVPILGWFFKSKEDFETGRELVIFLTPSILRASGVTAALPPAPPSSSTR